MKKIRNTIMLIGLCLGSVALAQEPGLVPLPTRVERGAGSFELRSSTPIRVTGGEHRQLGTMLAQYLAPATGWSLDVDMGEPVDGAICISLGGDAEDLGKEGYRLAVTPSQILIEAAAPAGAFYGIQTLRQLLPPAIYGGTPIANATEWSVPCVTVEDTPQFGWRGLMLDPARFFIEVKDLKVLIDAMAMSKLNRLHLHLTDNEGWRLPVKEYPKLIEIGARGDIAHPNAGPPLYYTPAQIRDLVAYAADRYITVVPEVDLPGHSMAAGRAYPNLYFGDQALHLGKPEAWTFTDRVLDAVMDLFPGPFIHFGGDEVQSKRWAKNPLMQKRMKQEGVTTAHGLEQAFNRHVADYIAAAGRRPMGWDEIAAANVNKKSVVMWWRNQSPESLQKALASGYNVVMVPNGDMYLNFRAETGERGSKWKADINRIEDIYSQMQVRNLSKQDLEKVLGVQACLWGEFLFDQEIMQYMLFPRLAAVAELAWSDPDSASFEDFRRRLTVETRRYEALGLNYRRDNVRHSLGSLSTSQGKNVTSFHVDEVIQKSGTYVVQIIQEGKKKFAGSAHVELLEDGKPLGSSKKPLDIAAHSRNGNVFNHLFTIDTVRPAADYQVRITMPAQGKKAGGVAGTVWMARVQPEGFGRIPYHGKKTWEPK